VVGLVEIFIRNLVNGSRLISLHDLASFLSNGFFVGVVSPVTTERVHDQVQRGYIIGYRGGTRSGTIGYIEGQSVTRSVH
jgi:hypothetical protein